MHRIIASPLPVSASSRLSSRSALEALVSDYQAAGKCVVHDSFDNGVDKSHVSPPNFNHSQYPSGITGRRFALKLAIHYSNFIWPGNPAPMARVLAETARAADEGGIAHMTMMDHYF